MHVHVCTVHPRLSEARLSESRLSDRLKLVTAHAQLMNFKMAAIIFVGVFTTLLWLIHCGAKEKERCIIGQVCKLLLFTMEILRRPRVLFLVLFNYPNKTAYPNTSIESAARSCSDNRGCTVYNVCICI